MININRVNINVYFLGAACSCPTAASCYVPISPTACVGEYYTCYNGVLYGPQVLLNFYFTAKFVLGDKNDNQIMYINNIVVVPLFVFSSALHPMFSIPNLAGVQDRLLLRATVS